MPAVGHVLIVGAGAAGAAAAILLARDGVSVDLIDNRYELTPLIPVADPVEKQIAEMATQSGQRGTDGGLRHTESQRGLGNTALREQRIQRQQQVEVQVVEVGRHHPTIIGVYRGNHRIGIPYAPPFRQG